jgi:hypothetical protein
LNWNFIGVITEIVGAIAIVVSLVYLAVQTRDNTRVMRSRAAWDSQQSYVEVNETLGDGGFVSDLMYKTFNEPDQLSDKEKYLAQRFYRGFFQRNEAQFALYQAGILDEEVWNLRRGYTKAIFNIPIARECWEVEKTNSMFTKKFIASIDSAVDLGMPSFLGAEK